MDQEKTTAQHHFHNAKNDMRKWLVDNGNKFIANIEPRLAASFNRFVKKEFPEIYEKAQEAVKSAMYIAMLAMIKVLKLVLLIHIQKAQQKHSFFPIQSGY